MLEKIAKLAFSDHIENNQIADSLQVATGITIFKDFKNSGSGDGDGDG